MNNPLQQQIEALLPKEREYDIDPKIVQYKNRRDIRITKAKVFNFNESLSLTKQSLPKIIELVMKDTIEKVKEKIDKVTTYDHSKRPLPQTCIGYGNCVSDIDNLFEELLTKEN